MCTWRFPGDVHHLDVGTHLQEGFQKLVGLAVEGARKHLWAASVFGGQLGHVEGGQRRQLGTHLLRLGGNTRRHTIYNEFHIHIVTMVTSDNESTVP